MANRNSQHSINVSRRFFLILAALLVVAAWRPVPAVQAAALTASPLSPFPVTNDTGLTADNFGYAVAIDGTTMVVGAIGVDTGRGAAYIYELSGDTWTKTATLTAQVRGEGDRFGYSVDISGDTIVVGADRADITYADQGAVYVFVKPADGWATFPTYIETAKLTVSDGAASDYFGSSVAISGGTIVVGAIGDDIGSPANNNQGSAYVFIGSGASWVQDTKLNATDGAADDWFGYSVDISGGTIVVGAQLDDVDLANQGSAYVFAKPAGSWEQQARLTTSAGQVDDSFGASVAISGDTIIIGAPGVNGPPQGAAYVFVRPGVAWTDTDAYTALLRSSNAAESVAFGSLVAINLSGETIAVGSPYDTVGATLYQGSTYLFARPGPSWSGSLTETLRLTAPDGAATDFYGCSVAISGSLLAVGAYGNDISGVVDQGSVYPYSLSGAATAVRLANFEASLASQSYVQQNVTLSWQTGYEKDLYGFNLYRSTSTHGEKIKLNESIVPATNSGSYTYPAQGQPGDLFWLELVTAQGSEFYGPLAVPCPKVYLPFLRH